jgi:hypothetical protein
MVGPGAAPARMPRKHSSGRPRVAVRAHYGALPSMAGRARTRGGESCLAREGEEPSVQWPEERPRGQKSPRWSAGRRDAPIARCVPRLTARIVTAPFGAPLPSLRGATPPSPLLGSKRDDGVARAATTGPAELCSPSSSPDLIRRSISSLKDGCPGPARECEERKRWAV